MWNRTDCILDCGIFKKLDICSRFSCLDILVRGIARCRFWYRVAPNLVHCFLPQTHRSLFAGMGFRFGAWKSSEERYQSSGSSSSSDGTSTSRRDSSVLLGSFFDNRLAIGICLSPLRLLAEITVSGFLFIFTFCSVLGGRGGLLGTW